MRPSASSPLQILIAALPPEILRAALLAVLTGGDDEAPKPAPIANHVAAAPPPATPAPPAKRRPGRPRKTGPDAAVLAARRTRAATAARAKRARLRAAKAGKANGHGKPTNGTGNGAEVAPGQAFWQHAERLRPRDPWVAVARELGVNPALSKDCYRSRALPPGLADGAVARFLELSVG